MRALGLPGYRFPVNLPNLLTLIRLCLTPAAVAVLFAESLPHFAWIALGLFCLLMLTDVADGIIARKYDLITRFGIFLDPLADKLLINLMLFSLASLGIVPFWLAVAHFMRDAISSEFKSFAAIQRVYIAIAPWEGKAKAFLQSMGIIAGLGAYAGVRPDLLTPLCLWLLVAALLVGLLGLGKLLAKHFRILLSPDPAR